MALQCRKHWQRGSAKNAAGVNNRAENSHPFRRRERAMLRFRQTRCLQKFASIHSSVHNHFNQSATSTHETISKLKREPPLLLSGAFVLRID